MNIQTVTANLWADFCPEDEPQHLCAYAAHFKQWADALCTAVSQDVQKSGKNGASAVVAVCQAKVLLVDKLFEWRSTAPKAHRNYTGDAHVCILRVFDDCYRTLRAIELSLTPPMLLLPPASPRAPRALSIADVVAFGAASPSEDWS